MNALCPCHSSTPKSLSQSSVIVYQGMCSHPWRSFNFWSSACGAREANASVTSGAFRPSKLYSFSTAIHGIRRRSAASASRARVCSFSWTSSSSRAVFHSSGETTGGVFTLLIPPSGTRRRVHEAAPDGPLAIHPLCHLAEFLISNLPHLWPKHYYQFEGQLLL